MSKVLCGAAQEEVDAFLCGRTWAVNAIRALAEKDFDHGNGGVPAQVMENEVLIILEWMKQGHEDQVREAMHEFFFWIGQHLWFSVWRNRLLEEIEAERTPQKPSMSGTVIPFRARAN